MASKVEICNLALQNLGANSITSLNENVAEAIECNLRYDTARRALLNMHVWNFATKRVALNRDVSTPAFNYTYRFTLPSDFLYMVMTSLEEQYQQPHPQVFNSILYTSDVPSYGGIDKYRIENSDSGLSLLSYEENVSIVYVSDIEDTQQYSAVFTDLFARYLGALISYRLTGSKSERDMQMKIFQSQLEEFQAIDSQQGVFDRIEVSEFLTARL